MGYSMPLFASTPEESQQRSCWDNHTSLQSPTRCLRNSGLQPIYTAAGLQGFLTPLLQPHDFKASLLAFICKAETGHTSPYSPSSYRTNRRSLRTGLPVELPGPPAESSRPSELSPFSPEGNHSSSWFLSLLAWPTHLLVCGGLSPQFI